MKFIKLVKANNISTNIEEIILNTLNTRFKHKNPILNGFKVTNNEVYIEIILPTIKAYGDGITYFEEYTFNDGKIINTKGRKERNNHSYFYDIDAKDKFNSSSLPRINMASWIDFEIRTKIKNINKVVISFYWEAD